MYTCKLLNSRLTFEVSNSIAFFFHRLSNDLIQYDRKLTLLSQAFIVKHHLVNKKSWIIILFTLFIYYVGSVIIQIYIWKPQQLNYTSIFIYLFNLPYIMDYVLIILTSFHLKNIGNRFQTLNDFWKALPTELIPIRGEWTHSEIEMLVESIRLLHAELCTILKLFSSSYGPVLLAFFVCNFLDFSYIIYIIIYHEVDSSKINLSQSIIYYIPIHLVNFQIIVFCMSIIIVASRITDKVGTFFFNKPPFHYYLYNT